MVYASDIYDNRRWLLQWEFSWLGFRAKGHELQRFGWQAESLVNHATFARSVVLHHKEQSVQFMSGWIDDYDTRDFRANVRDTGILSIGLRSCARQHNMMVHSTQKYYTESLDLNPREITYKDICIGDLFPKQLVVQQSHIIVPKDPTVDDLLQQILAKQQPAQVEYFNNKVKNGEVPEATMMGQIIQLRA